MDSITYELPDQIYANFDFIKLLARAEDAVARLDERVKLSPLREGWQQRQLFFEACACLDAEHELVHLEDLVLLDGRAFQGVASPALSRAWHVLHVWRKAVRADAARLLDLERPGEAEAFRAAVYDNESDQAPDQFFDPSRQSADRLGVWRQVLARSRQDPPLIAAAMAWDAWLVLAPEERGAWRAPLIAALVLRARAKTRSLLLPIDTGRRHSRNDCVRNQDVVGRINDFLDWCITAADRSELELNRLTAARALLASKLECRRRNSRLAELVDLLLSRPLISIPMAAKVLSCSAQAVTGMLAELGSLPREMSGRKRYRVWTI